MSCVALCPCACQVEVQELVQGKRKLVWVDAEDTLEHALGVLRERSILAMPVRLKQPQEVGGAALPQEFCGLVRSFFFLFSPGSVPGVRTMRLYPVSVPCVYILRLYRVFVSCVSCGDRLPGLGQPVTLLPEACATSVLFWRESMCDGGMRGVRLLADGRCEVAG